MPPTRHEWGTLQVQVRSALKRRIGCVDATVVGVDQLSDDLDELGYAGMARSYEPAGRRRRTNVNGELAQ